MNDTGQAVQASRASEEPSEMEPGNTGLPVRLAAQAAALTDRRDTAFSTLTDLEAARVHLASQARSGDVDAVKALVRLKSQIAQQAALAADLDAAVDLTECRRAAIPDDNSPISAAKLARVRHLGVRRIEIARRMESLMEGLVAAWREMHALQAEFEAEGALVGAVAAELHRFRDRFEFYHETMLDFVAGVPRHRAHPCYRKLSTLMIGPDDLAAAFARDRDA